MADDFRPFLQIVHISDLHVVSTSFQGWKGFRFVRRLIRLMSADLEREILDGTAPHDPMAPYAFADFLEEITTNDADWVKATTWLIDSGDLTTFGDVSSLEKGDDYKRLFKHATSAASVYGNHDAWPSKFPLLASHSKLTNQPHVLASRGYYVDSSTLALNCPIPNSRGEVKLFSVDSVDYGRYSNTRAFGQVGHNQLDQLSDLVEKTATQGPDFRILVVHHPVHYPTPPLLRAGMVMTNDHAVARFLDGKTLLGKHPIVHLILSGHTHTLFPGHGQLPPSARLCSHWDLGLDQCQLIVGSLIQLDRFNKRGDSPHQCQVLRLYCSSSRPDIIRVERLLAARKGGPGTARGAATGPYQFVSVPSDPRKIAEEIIFAL